MTMNERPQNIGIKAMELYVPGKVVNQAELEKFDEIPQGKYTIGLGQTNMSFVDDREDIYSFMLTAVSKLMEKNGIDANSVGRVDVGTETLLDKSKSVKSVLMQLFGDNTDIEGLDSVNACYGGTNALFNAVNWIESSSWDGRNAIVVAGDIAIYAKGNARPTGGAGAVAMLIGPDAPLVMEPVHGTYMAHAYDFYKPDFTSEYPMVDGQFSLTCYTKAVDACYAAYNKKSKNADKGIDQFDYSVFHVPTCKLVSKSYARLLYNDFRKDPSKFQEGVPDAVKDLDYEASLTDKTVEKTFLGLAKERSATRLAPSLNVPTNTGNMYTASVFCSLASLLTYVNQDDLAGKRISLFSYGSGLAASLYSMVVKGDISSIVKNLDVKSSLENRTTFSPAEYEAALALREKAHLAKNFSPQGDLATLKKGTYYLTEINEKFQRKYAVKN
jgi:hydroxymethylglutaryl-CoA synthase